MLQQFSHEENLIPSTSPENSKSLCEIFSSIDKSNKIENVNEGAER